MTSCKNEDESKASYFPFSLSALRSYYFMVHFVMTEVSFMVYFVGYRLPSQDFD